MLKAKWMTIAVLACLALAGAPALAQDNGQAPASGYQMPPAAPGQGPLGPGMGRPPFGPPPALGGRYQVVSGDYTAWRGSRPETVKAVIRVDSNTGETWILQEASEGGQTHRQWVKISEAR